MYLAGGCFLKFIDGNMRGILPERRHKDSMILNIANHDFSIIWEGVYYKALSNYPNLSNWEIKSIIEFMDYENEHGREVTFEIENEALLKRVLKEVQNKEKYRDVKKPGKIKECTACKQKGCMTDYLCHIAPIENAIQIIKSGKLLSAKNARHMRIEDLVREDRNAAKDPADFFEYIMFSWGNCQAGDRLVMERKHHRPPTEEDLSVHFTPGVRFYFDHNELIKHPSAKQDGYHALKIKDELDIEPYLKAIIVPEAYYSLFERMVGASFKRKTHYLKNDCHDIWEWSEKVYNYVSLL